MAYLSGKTKEHALLIDEDDERAYRSKRRHEPPAKSSATPVIDLTLSDDEVGGRSVARSAVENRRSINHGNTNSPLDGFAVQSRENALLERAIPRTHPAKTAPHTAPTPVEGSPPIRNIGNAKELQEQAMQATAPSSRISNAGLPQRTKTPETSKTDASPCSTMLPPVTQGSLYPAVHPSPENSVPATRPQQKASLPDILSSIRVTMQRKSNSPVTVDSMLLTRDEIKNLGSPGREAALQLREQTPLSSVNVSSPFESRSTAFGLGETAKALSSESVEERMPQPMSVTAFERKQRAIKSANRTGDDRAPRSRLPTNQFMQSPSRPPSQPVTLQGVSPSRPNGDSGFQSPPNRNLSHDPRLNIKSLMNPPLTGKLKTSDASVGSAPAAIVHDKQNEASSLSGSGNHNLTPSSSTMPTPVMDDKSHELPTNVGASKTSEPLQTETSQSKSTQPTLPRDAEIDSNEQVPLEEVLVINGDDYIAARSGVEACLKQQLMKRHEMHADITRSLMWRERICFESELRAQRRQRRGQAPKGLPKKYVQSASPFKDMQPIETPFDRKSSNEGTYDFSQEMFGSVKPKDPIARSGWISSTTKYTSTAVHIPTFKEYISVKNNILADNESKLYATPYFADEDDQNRQDMRAELPQHYEMKHDINAYSDLRNEQCRFFKDIVETFLRRIGVSWSAILYWLLASDSEIKRINNACKGSAGFEELLLQRLVYRSENFTRDQQTLTANLFEPQSQRRQLLLSMLEEPTVKELRLSALACAAVLEECGFSIWYLAQQSDTMSEHVSRKIKKAVSSSGFAYRDAVCRVCHQHYCLLHGELREVPGDFWEIKSNGNESRDEKDSDDFEDRTSSAEDMPPRKNSQRHENRVEAENEVNDDGDDDDDYPAPAHWDDDSDIEKVINYKLPTNPEAFNANPESEMIEPKGLKPPDGQFNRRWWHENTYAHRWDERKPFFPCSHEGSCEQAQCRCFRENITCEKTCKCSQLCKRRFPGCNCVRASPKRVCTTVACLCVKFSRECDADLCGGCGASEILDPVNKYNEDILEGRCFNVAIQRGVPKKTLLGHSEVHGFGLYVGEDVKKDEYIGEYVGEIVSVQEGVRRYTIYHYQQTMYLFKLNTKQEVDATFMGNKLRFINDANKKYTNCAPRNLLCNTVFRLALYATTDIKAGTELFFYYNYPKETTAHFKQPTGKGGVVAVKQTVKPAAKRKAKSKDPNSFPYKASAISTLKSSSKHKPRVKTEPEKAKVGKGKRKIRDAFLTENPSSTQTASPSGPQRARKTAPNEAIGHPTSRVVQLSRRGIKTIPRFDSEASDFTAATDDSSRFRRNTEGHAADKVIQDTDEEDADFLPEGDAADSERSRSRLRRNKAMMTAGSSTPRSGESSLAGRKRPIVLNSDDE